MSVGQTFQQFYTIDKKYLNFIQREGYSLCQHIKEIWLPKSGLIHHFCLISISLHFTSMQAPSQSLHHTITKIVISLYKFTYLVRVLSSHRH